MPWFPILQNEEITKVIRITLGQAQRSLNLTLSFFLIFIYLFITIYLVALGLSCSSRAP